MRDPWVRTTSLGGEAPAWYSSTAWHTMNVTGWWSFLRAHGFRIAPARWTLAAVATLYTINNSVLGLVQSAIFRSRLRRTKIAPDPLFILGHWRSGTTHLHELISLDDRFAFPTTYECATPQHFLLTDRVYPRLFSWVLPSRRVMDNMKQGFERPQEDEVALVALGLPSPMWTVGYADDREGQAYLTLHSVSARCREKWIQTLRHFLVKVTYRHTGKPLALKSPGHTARIELLYNLFPGARFLHIVRDPYVVFASTVNLWRKQLAINGLVKYDPVRLEDKVLQTLRDMYKDFDRERANLPQGQFHQLTYEELIREPIPTLQRCYAALGLGDFAAVEHRVVDYLSRVRDYRVNEYELSSSGKDVIREAWGPIFRGWGYDI